MRREAIGDKATLHRRPQASRRCRSAIVGRMHALTRPQRDEHERQRDHKPIHAHVATLDAHPREIERARFERIEIADERREWRQKNRIHVRIRRDAHHPQPVCQRWNSDAEQLNRNTQRAQRGKQRGKQFVCLCERRVRSRARSAKRETESSARESADPSWCHPTNNTMPRKVKRKTRKAKC